MGYRSILNVEIGQLTNLRRSDFEPAGLPLPIFTR